MKGGMETTSSLPSDGRPDGACPLYLPRGPTWASMAPPWFRFSCLVPFIMEHWPGDTFCFRIVSGANELWENEALF